MRRLASILALLLALAGMVRATETWRDANYPYRREITIDNTNVDSALTDFPLLVVVDGGAPAGGGDGVLSANIADDRYAFYDSAGSNLYHEQEFYLEGASYVEMTMWVKVPTIASGATTSIWIYYGYDDGAQSNAANTWSDYTVVMHFEGASPFTDSTGNGHSGTDSNTAQSTGIVGNAREWDASTDVVTIADHADLDGFDDFTAQAWGFADTTGSDTEFGRTFGKSDATYGGAYEMNFGGDEDDFDIWVNGDDLQSNVMAAGDVTGAWHLFAMTYERNTVGGKIFYVDGAVQGSENAPDAAVAAEASDIHLGNSPTAARGWDGDLDEFRLRASIPTNAAAQLKFEYHNATEADNEITISAIENKPAAGGAGWLFFPHSQKMRSQ